MTRLIHTVPVGGEEPMHDATLSCWCFPAHDRDTPEVIVHNAKDCREAKERNGSKTSGDQKWVLVGQLLNNP